MQLPQSMQLPHSKFCFLSILVYYAGKKHLISSLQVGSLALAFAAEDVFK